MADTKQLFIEVPKEDVVKHVLEYAFKSYYKSWGNINLLLCISHAYYFVNEPNELIMLKEVLIDVWTQKANDTKREPCVIARVIMLRYGVGIVIKSRLAGMLIEENVVKQLEASAMNRLTTNITDRIGVSSVTIASSSYPVTAAVKKRKTITPKDSKGLSDYEQTVLLVDKVRLD